MLLQIAHYTCMCACAYVFNLVHNFERRPSL